MPITTSSEFSDVLSDNYVAGAITVTTSQTEAKVGGSRLIGREYITVYNNSSQTIYFGPSGVTTSSGTPLEKGQTAGFPAGDIGIFLIVSGGTANVRIQEWA
jgi:hypothetical protein